MRIPALSRRAAARYGYGAAVALAGFLGLVALEQPRLWLGIHAARAGDAPAKNDPTDPNAAGSVSLNESQLRSINIEPVTTRRFVVEDEAIGGIDFNEDMTAQVFTPYQGRIVQLFAKVGDDVTKGQLLFTIDSPDLIQAESSLIQAAGVLRLTTRTLDRTRALVEAKGAAQKDLDQAISDQQTAQGALEAGRDAVRIFGKTPEDIDKIVASRRIDPILEVHSPIAGKVTARAAAPGLFVQPGNAPAPFTVADISTMWMLANVPEETVARYAVGQKVTVRVPAWPERTFDGHITTIGSTVDPNTRRVFLRSEIVDPDHCLRSGMFASFVIETGRPVASAAVPDDGVVREGDGTMTVWVTADRKSFVKRPVTLGLHQNGFYQVTSGLHAGDLIAGSGALFLSNALNGVSSD